MKKVLFPFIFIILIIGGGILFWQFKNGKEQSDKTSEKPKHSLEIQEKLDKLDNIQEKIDYFNMDYLNRYLNYKDKNPTLKVNDVITRVNIGLDKAYYTNTIVSPYLNQVYLLSNKYISMPSDYIPDNLEEISNTCARSGMRLVSIAKEKFESLCRAATKEGLTVRAMSSYRSYSYQENLYNRYVKEDGKEKADTYSARPGFSEHQTGLVVDVDNNDLSYTNFEKTEEFLWMKENAHKYGFILRYPKGKEEITGYTYESWHYRYVGIDIATYIYENDITFDEYYVMFIEGKK